MAIGTANLAGSATRMAITLPMAVVSTQARDILEQELSGAKTRITNGRVPY